MEDGQKVCKVLQEWPRATWVATPAARERTKAARTGRIATQTGRGAMCDGHLRDGRGVEGGSCGLCCCDLGGLKPRKVRAAGGLIQLHQVIACLSRLSPQALDQRVAESRVRINPVRPSPKTMSDMQDVPNPLGQVLRDYLHVEWYELNDLIAEVQSPHWGVGVDSFKQQLQSAITQGNLSVESVRRLTGQEFHSQRELTAWLMELWSALFKEPIQ